MLGRFELFDHTADIGVRVFAPTMQELVEPAGRGLYAVIGELKPDPAKPAGAPAPLEFAGDDPALLLRDYLAELLRRFDTYQQMATAVEVTNFTRTSLAGAVRFAGIDLDHSDFEREVKAVTYHELNLRSTPSGVEATFIVDI
jgi:SHS2 domain-containing protein